MPAAKLAAITLFPSPEMPEVIRILLFFSDIPKNVNAALIFLICSDMMLFFHDSITKASLVFSKKTSPKICIEVSAVISSLNNTFLLKPSIKVMKTTGTPNANAKAAK
jgi:hypothetical protein